MAEIEKLNPSKLEIRSSHPTDALVIQYLQTLLAQRDRLQRQVAEEKVVSAAARPACPFPFQFSTFVTTLDALVQPYSDRLRRTSSLNATRMKLQLDPKSPGRVFLCEEQHVCTSCRKTFFSAGHFVRRFEYC